MFFRWPMSSRTKGRFGGAGCPHRSAAFMDLDLYRSAQHLFGDVCPSVRSVDPVRYLSRRIVACVSVSVGTQPCPMPRHFRATIPNRSNVRQHASTTKNRVGIGNASDPRRRYGSSSQFSFAKHAGDMVETKKHASAENRVGYMKRYSSSTESKQRSESQDMYITELVDLNTVAG